MSIGYLIVNLVIKKYTKSYIGALQKNVLVCSGLFNFLYSITSV